jgi:D-xylose transport system substrate-binding protein
MKMHLKVIAGATLAMLSSLSMAQLVGVSWSNFQEERWTTDEKAIKDQLAKLGGTYVSADAAASAEKQLADVDGLINKGAKVLLILAMDKDAIAPALVRQQGSRTHAGACDLRGQA